MKFCLGKSLFVNNTSALKIIFERLSYIVSTSNEKIFSQLRIFPHEEFKEFQNLQESISDNDCSLTFFCQEISYQKTSVKLLALSTEF